MKISIAGLPPTKRALRRAHYRFFLLSSALVNALPMLVLFLSPSSSPAHGFPLSETFLVSLSLTTLFWICSSYRSIPASRAGEMLQLTQATPAGALYGTYVTLQGRPFVYAELDALKAWNEQRANHANQQLNEAADELRTPRLSNQAPAMKQSMSLHAYEN